MQTLLYISSSLFGGQGKSTELTQAYVGALLEANPDLSVIRRDLAVEPIPHLDGERFSAFIAPAEERSEAQRAVAALSDQLIDEWRRADAVVIGLPMYNLGVPSVFKAYLDHVVRAGETFRYTEQGPQGLLKDRKVTVVATRGGIYAGTSLDTQSGFIRNILGLMGITDVEVIYAEGLNTGEETASAALQQARAQLQQKAS